MTIRLIVAILAIAALTCGAAFAQDGPDGPAAGAEAERVQADSQDKPKERPASRPGEEEEDDKHKVSVALAYGVFKPSNADVRDRFGDTLTRFSLLTFEPRKPAETRFTWEAGAYRASRASFSGGHNKVRLYTVGLGFQRGFGERESVRPYVLAHIGPYYGQVRVPLEGIDESKFGLNINACLGVIFDRRFYIEARYDYFSKIAGFSFDGFSISGGIRLFDVKF